MVGFSCIRVNIVNGTTSYIPRCICLQLTTVVSLNLLRKEKQFRAGWRQEERKGCKVRCMHVIPRVLFYYQQRHFGTLVSVMIRNTVSEIQAPIPRMFSGTKRSFVFDLFVGLSPLKSALHLAPGAEPKLSRGPRRRYIMIVADTARSLPLRPQQAP